MYSSCCKENNNIYRFPVPNHALWYTRCPDSVHKTVHQVLSYCAFGLASTPCSRELSMADRSCFPEMPRRLPPPPQSALSLLFSGRTTLQCNSPSRAPHSLWDQPKARFLLKLHLCPAFPSGSPAPFSYLAAVKSVTNKYFSNKQTNKKPQWLYFGLSHRYDLMEWDTYLSDG